MKSRYPPIEPNKTGFLQVSRLHTLYWEESGNPKGKPIVFLHGGPGAGTDPNHRTFFDPYSYRIILFDQRGSGKSLPHACLEENTTWDLVEDLEKLRKYLGISSWVVFGGSWGSTLALSYAITHPQRVLGLILRGIFLGSQEEIQWFYQSGAKYLFPDLFQDFSKMIPLEERDNLVKAYYKRLSLEDSTERLKYAKAWSIWEASTVRLEFDPAFFTSFTQDFKADAIARIECHYFLNDCFFKENQILKSVNVIRSIPGFIIHGRYDVICPLDSAWKLHQVWPEAKFQIVSNAGHSASEPGITNALIKATDFLRD
jgi:proline iminopeptidase